MGDKEVETIQKYAEDNLKVVDEVGEKEAEDGTNKGEIETSPESAENKLKVIKGVVEKEFEHRSDRGRDRRLRKRRRGFDEEVAGETSYFFKDGLQFVFPYFFEYKIFVKTRWLNTPILDVFCDEFRKETAEHYKRALKTGKIKVNDQLVSEDYILKIGDNLVSMVHRHEPPVIHLTIEFIQNEDDLIVIDKPSSIPVYPSGRYRHNSILLTLATQYNLCGLIALNGVDRNTSGVLMLAKTKAKAKEMGKRIRQMVKKEYLARVVGEFPSGETIVNAPILVASSQIGLCYVHPDGKPSTTKFKRIEYNGKSSLVSCKPETSRMHQIRVHLHHLGHPIINDPMYNHPTAWVKHNGTYNINEALKELFRTRDDDTNEYESVLKTSEFDSNDTQIKSESISEENVVCHKRRKLEVGTESGSCNEATERKKERTYYSTSSYFSDLYIDEDCTDCKRKWRQPLPSELVMYLHLISFKGPDFEYKTSLPSWAMEGWDSS